MLPTMQGMEFLELGNEADEVGKARVIEYWRYLQTKKNMKGYTLKHIYDAGVRESYRLVGKYVLREQDLRRGKPDLENYRRIAIADHAAALSHTAASPIGISRSAGNRFAARHHAAASISAIASACHFVTRHI